MRTLFGPHPVTHVWGPLPPLTALKHLAAQTVSQETVDILVQQPSKYALAVALCQFYERGCETYDRLVCTRRSKLDRRVVLPQDGIEQLLVARNAQFQLYLLRFRAMNLAIPDDLLSRAKHDPLRWRWEDEGTDTRRHVEPQQDPPRGPSVSSRRRWDVP